MLQKIIIYALLFMGPLLLSGQSNYLSDELIIEFENNTSVFDKMVTRFQFGVTNLEVIDGDLELWRGMTFPKTVVIGGMTLVFNSVEDIVGWIDNNNNGGSQSNRAKINNGDLQYLFAADPLNGSATTQTSPLPNCPTEEYRVVGTPDLASTNHTRVIVFDQRITATAYFPNLVLGARIVNDQNGTHGNEVASVIKHTLDEAGMSTQDYDLVTYGVFKDDGTATYSDILKAFHQVDIRGEQDVIINMSASAEFVNEENGRTILDDVIGPMLAANNILLITSVGNDALSSNKIYPACAKMTHQMSVAGSMNCFSLPWSGTNENDRYFSIVAEAVDVRTYDGQSQYLSTGTSFAAPLVTATAVQVNTQQATFDAIAIRDHILETADVKEAFLSIVDDGKVINATAATDQTAPLQQSSTGQTTISTNRFGEEATLIKVGPNPFRDHINIQAASTLGDQDLILKLFHASGVLVTEQLWPADKSGSWQLPATLPTGNYILQLNGEGVTQTHLRLIKH